MRSHFCYFIAVLAFAHLTNGIPVDNAVIGDPEISCDADGIGINIATRNAFGGHIYVKVCCSFDISSKVKLEIQQKFQFIL